MRLISQTATPPNPEIMWAAFIARDARWDGRFVAGVRTTGIFCRPTCTCRKPLRRNVRFFASPADASHAGFRPCKRCRPELAGGASEADRRLAARVLALMRGRFHLSVADVIQVAPAVLRHRIILNFDAHAEGQTPETILSKIIPSVAAAVH